MKKVELLAPAGNFECLVAAIQNGADAIYLGGQKFNARAYATNFDEKTLEEAVLYAHLYGVKIYVTLNTLYYDEEIEEVMHYVDFLYHLQVDALIIQDAGLMAYIHQVYPDFELHASTQCSIVNVDGVKRMASLGAKRVVLARENTLEEIQKICAQCDVEIEVFIHGALCMSYSGQCLMSSMIGGRSGNRGACAQPCRLEYQLLEDGKPLQDDAYLLSLKDLYTLDHIPDLIHAQVTSLKIEGRMKKPEYVAYVVASYRQAIDAAYKKEKRQFIKDQKMALLFNRGFTQGYMFHSQDMMAKIYPSHRGIDIGIVTGYRHDKHCVMVKLSDTLKQGDSIAFEHNNEGRVVNKLFLKDHLIKEAKATDDVEIEFSLPIKKGTHVFKTSSIDLLREIQQSYQKIHRHIPVCMTFSLKLQEKPLLKISDGYYEVEVTSSYEPELALQTPLDQERVERQLSKLGGTVFSLDQLIIDMDDHLSFPIKALNEMRREAVTLLEHHRRHRIIHHEQKKNVSFPLSQRKKHIQALDVKVLNLEHVRLLKPYWQDIGRIYFPFGDDLKVVCHLLHETSIDVIPYFSSIMKDDELEAVKKHPLYDMFSTFLIGDYGQKLAFRGKRCIEDSSLNATNSYHLSLQEDGSILNFELSKGHIQNLQTVHEVTMPVYGAITMMISEYCPISTHYFGYKKPGCQYCQKHHYALLDRKGKEFNVWMDHACRMHLLNHYPLYIDDLTSLHVDRILLTLSFEDEKTIGDIMNYYRSCVFNTYEKVEKPRLIGTYGYFYGKK